MKKLLSTFLIALSALALTGCGNGTVKEGNAGVVYNWENKFSDVIDTGFYWKPFSEVDEYTMKEVTVTFENLKPKAKDDLSLQELDVDIIYRVTSKDGLARLVLKRSGSSARFEGDDFWSPAYNFVKQTAESEIADATSSFDSLTIHKSRDALAKEIHTRLQNTLKSTDGDDIQIIRVQVRKASPDATIEKSIREVINKEKEYQAAVLAVKVADENAKAVAKTANTLTPAFLQHEYNQVLMKFAENGGTVILDGSGSNKILNLK